MQTHVRGVDQQYAALFHQLQDVHAKWQAAEGAKSRLERENASLRSLQVRNDLDKDKRLIAVIHLLEFGRGGGVKFEIKCWLQSRYKNLQILFCVST